MFESLNPLYRKNPMWPCVKQLGVLQKRDLIKKEEIDSILERMALINGHYFNASNDIRLSKSIRDKARAGYHQFEKTIKGVMADLSDTNKYVLSDGYYIKQPGNTDG